MVLHALPWTLGLVGVTTVLAFVLGTLIGLVSAWRRGTWLDSALPPIFVITSAFPYFWVGLLLIYIFTITLGWLPIMRTPTTSSPTHPGLEPGTTSATCCSTPSSRA